MESYTASFFDRSWTRIFLPDSAQVSGHFSHMFREISVFLSELHYSCFVCMCGWGKYFINSFTVIFRIKLELKRSLHLIGVGLLVNCCTYFAIFLRQTSDHWFETSSFLIYGLDGVNFPHSMALAVSHKFGYVLFSFSFYLYYLKSYIKSRLILRFPGFFCFVFFKRRGHQDSESFVFCWWNHSWWWWDLLLAYCFCQSPGCPLLVIA